MISRLAAAAAIAATMAWSCVPALGDSAPGGQPNVAALNRYLADLLVSERPSARKPRSQMQAFPAPGARFAAATQPTHVSLAPFLLSLASRYNKAERILHYQSHGFDADFWGALSGGRVRLRYVVRF